MILMMLNSSASVVNLAYIVFIPQFQTTLAESYERCRKTTWLSHEDTGMRENESDPSAAARRALSQDANGHVIYPEHVTFANEHHEMIHDLRRLTTNARASMSTWCILLRKHLTDN